MKIEWIEKYLVEAEQMIYDNRLQDAMTMLENLLYAEPGYNYLHNVIGWAHLYYTGNAEKAERHLKVSLHFQSQFAAPYLHLATLYTRAARYDEAITMLESGVKVPGANAATFYEQLAYLYELKGNFKKAIHCYKQALMGTASQDAYRFTESIKRCRKKRWVMMFSF